jgi:hypothetical protein
MDYISGGVLLTQWHPHVTSQKKDQRSLISGIFLSVLCAFWKVFMPERTWEKTNVFEKKLIDT